MRPFFLEGSALSSTYERERELTREVTERVEQTLPDVEVLAVELLSPARFCVYVDHPEGVDHGVCERVTSLLRDYLDRYSVDVSSPGPQPPLRKPAHFRKALGRRVALRTASPIAGRTKVRGEVVAATDEAVRVRDDKEELEVPYEALVRGNLIDEGVTQ